MLCNWSKIRSLIIIVVLVFETIIGLGGTLVLFKSIVLYIKFKGDFCKIFSSFSSKFIKWFAILIACAFSNIILFNLSSSSEDFLMYSKLSNKSDFCSTTLSFDDCCSWNACPYPREGGCISRATDDATSILNKAFWYTLCPFITLESFQN